MCGSETASKVVFCMAVYLYFGACNIAEKCVRCRMGEKERGGNPKNERTEWEREFAKQVHFCMSACVRGVIFEKLTSVAKLKKCVRVISKYKYVKQNQIQNEWEKVH